MGTPVRQPCERTNTNVLLEITSLKRKLFEQPTDADPLVCNSNFGKHAREKNVKIGLLEVGMEVEFGTVVRSKIDPTNTLDVVDLCWIYLLQGPNYEEMFYSFTRKSVTIVAVIKQTPPFPFHKQIVVVCVLFFFICSLYFRRT